MRVAIIFSVAFLGCSSLIDENKEHTIPVRLIDGGLLFVVPQNCRPNALPGSTSCDVPISPHDVDPDYKETVKR